jgi:hypothetical protein
MRGIAQRQVCCKRRLVRWQCLAATLWPHACHWMCFHVSVCVHSDKTKVSQQNRAKLKGCVCVCGCLPLTSHHGPMTCLTSSVFSCVCGC